MLFGLIAMFFPGKTIKLVYASFGALLFCIYLVYDTQLMMGKLSLGGNNKISSTFTCQNVYFYFSIAGGNHKYSISPEDYVFAALNLYLDIVNIFMYTLTILGAIRD